MDIYMIMGQCQALRTKRIIKMRLYYCHSRMMRKAVMCCHATVRSGKCLCRNTTQKLAYNTRSSVTRISVAIIYDWLLLMIKL